MKQLITIALIALAFSTANAAKMSFQDAKDTQRSADMATVAKANLDHTSDETPSIYDTCNNDHTNTLTDEQYQQALIEACERLGL